MGFDVAKEFLSPALLGACLYILVGLRTNVHELRGAVNLANLRIVYLYGKLGIELPSGDKK